MFTSRSTALGVEIAAGAAEEVELALLGSLCLLLELLLLDEGGSKAGDSGESRDVVMEGLPDVVEVDVFGTVFSPVAFAPTGDEIFFAPPDICQGVLVGAFGEEPHALAPFEASMAACAVFFVDAAGVFDGAL